MNPRAVHLNWRGIARFLIRDRHDAWSFLNVGGRFAFRLVTLSLLVKVLSPEELALWYVFIAAFGVSAILEGGVKLVVTQQVAARPRTAVAPFCLAVLQLYRGLVAAVCLVALFFGDWWLTHKMGVPADGTVRMLWPVFVLANGIGLLSGIQGGIISGLGEVAISQRNELIGQGGNALVFLVLWVSAFVSGLALPTLALLASTMTAWWVNFLSLRKLLSSKRRPLARGYLQLVGKTLLNNAGKMLLSILSYHMLTSIFLLLLSAYQAPEVVAAYGLSLQVLMMVLSIAVIWVRASFPRMAAAVGDSFRLQREFISAIKRTLPVLFIGMIATVLMAPFLINLIRGENSLLPSTELYFLAVILTIENIFFTLAANLLQSQGHYGHVAVCSFIFAGSALVGTYSSLAFFGWGLTGALVMRLILGIITFDIPIGMKAIQMVKVVR